jgi:hypothetical protein
MIVNAHWTEKRFALPDLSAFKLGKPGAWRRIMDTSLPDGREFPAGAGPALDPQTAYPMAPRSVAVLEA